MARPLTDPDDVAEALRTRTLVMMDGHRYCSDDLPHCGGCGFPVMAGLDAASLCPGCADVAAEEASEERRLIREHLAGSGCDVRFGALYGG